MTNTSEFYRFQNGPKAALAFETAEYEARLDELRERMDVCGATAAILTSAPSLAYYTGLSLGPPYGSTAHPYALVVSEGDAVTISPGQDAGHFRRRSFVDTISYCCSGGQHRDFWQAIASVIGQGGVIGYEGNHMTLALRDGLEDLISPWTMVDLAPGIAQQRMYKSEAEITLIRAVARVADHAGQKLREAIRLGAREIDVAMAGRNAMEQDIAIQFPEAEFRDSAAWVQSGLNTDNAQSPPTGRRIAAGDILSLTSNPVIWGYGLGLKRNLFAGSPEEASLEYWCANLAAHEFATSLLQPGARWAEVTGGINAYQKEHDLLDLRRFGAGLSMGACGDEMALPDDSDLMLEPGMIVSQASALIVPDGKPGSGGYWERDVVVITEGGAEGITTLPRGPEVNVIA